MVPADIFVSGGLSLPNNSNYFAAIFAQKQYRLLHSFQAKFLIDDEGKIEAPAASVIHNLGSVGVTKLKAGFLKGEFGTVGGVDFPPVTWSYDISTEPAETNAFNEMVSYSTDGKSISSFATGRIGLKGRQASYRQFGKDAPWIFSEIILQLDPQGEVMLLGRTSVTAQWEFDAAGLVPNVNISRAPAAPGTTPGISIFNNLNVYTRSQLDRVERPSGGLMGMDGHLKSFVESPSGAWPEPAIGPSIH